MFKLQVFCVVLCVSSCLCAPRHRRDLDLNELMGGDAHATLCYHEEVTSDVKRDGTVASGDQQRMFAQTSHRATATNLQVNTKCATKP